MSALGNCINALTKAKKGHIPYRDSKLTFLLRVQKELSDVHAQRACVRLHVKFLLYLGYTLMLLLKESLGGNAKTTLIVCCSPHKFNVEETLSALQFAARAKSIKNTVKVNKQRSVEELNRILAKLSKEFEMLKAYCTELEAEILRLNPKFDLNSIRKACVCGIELL